MNLFSALLILVVSAIASGFVVEASQDAIRMQVDLVVVPASIREKNGSLISDLKREDFRLLEDGRPQEIRSVSFEYQPLSAVVLIESDLWPFFQQAKPVPFGQVFSDSDEVAVDAFDVEIEKVVAFTNRARDIDMGFRTAMQKSKGRPIAVRDRNLNSALLRAIADLDAASSGHRRVVIIVGAGLYGDETSPSVIQDQLSRNQIQVYTVRTGGHSFPKPAPFGLFRSYAESTGGDVYSAADPNDELSAALKRIVEEAHQHYIISYVSNNIVPAGQGRPRPVIRRIDLKVNRASLNVSHRKTYLQYRQAE